MGGNREGEGNGERRISFKKKKKKVFKFPSTCFTWTLLPEVPVVLIVELTYSQSLSAPLPWLNCMLLAIISSCSIIQTQAWIWILRKRPPTHNRMEQEKANILTNFNCMAICFRGTQGGWGCLLLSSSYSAPSRWPWPQLWRPPPPPPPICSWAAGLLVGGMPNPATPALLLGKYRYLGTQEVCRSRMSSMLINNYYNINNNINININNKVASHSLTYYQIAKVKFWEEK